jgi:hypothetical protein
MNLFPGRPDFSRQEISDIFLDLANHNNNNNIIIMIYK